MNVGPDRLKLLVAPGQNELTGIDYVKVATDQMSLDVHFHKDPTSLTTPLDADLDAEQIRIEAVNPDEPRRSVAVEGAPTWPIVEGERVMHLDLQRPGGFSWYKLSIDDARVDAFFNHVRFSFKANCDNPLDCRPRSADCPPQPQVDFPVDYGAKDYRSFRQALLDFSSQRYDHWQDRLEADAGVMLGETLSALGDELSYYQDRVAREAYLATATQRRSLRRMARLVNYELHDGLAPWTWIDVTVVDGQTTTIPAGGDLWAQSDGGSAAAAAFEPNVAGETARVHYEAGWGLEDALAGGEYDFDSLTNSLAPYIWEEDSTCLPAGATELHVTGLHQSKLLWNDTPPGRLPGRWVLLKSDPEDRSQPARRHAVRVIEIIETSDPLTGQALTRITWEAEQALPWELDLTHAEVRGNLLPATCGKTFPHDQSAVPTRFVVEDEPGTLGVPEADALRMGRTIDIPGARDEGVPVFTLPGSNLLPVAFVGATPGTATPEVAVWREEWDGSTWHKREDWILRRSLVGGSASRPQDRDVVLEDGSWQRVAALPITGGQLIHEDYAGTDGKTLRFGDGEFGRRPAAGTVFGLQYRLWQPDEANVSAGAIRHYDDAAFPNVEAVENPFEVTTGIPPEAAESLRQQAPYAYQVEQYRAVKPEDYREAAERLSWVERAGAAFRWTGSWRLGVVTPDPAGTTVLAESHRDALGEQMDRFRQAGHDVRVAAPRYADIDLKITLCLTADIDRAHVLQEALEALLGTTGFFRPAHFTFGTPLRSSALQAVLQGIVGVRAVGDMSIRRRGYFDWRPFLEPYYPVEPDAIVRIENDPVHPQRGSLEFTMEGGV